MVANSISFLFDRLTNNSNEGNILDTSCGQMYISGIF